MGPVRYRRRIEPEPSNFMPMIGQLLESLNSHWLKLKTDHHLSVSVRHTSPGSKKVEFQNIRDVNRIFENVQYI